MTTDKREVTYLGLKISPELSKLLHLNNLKWIKILDEITTIHYGPNFYFKDDNITKNKILLEKFKKSKSKTQGKPEAPQLQNYYLANQLDLQSIHNTDMIT